MIVLLCLIFALKVINRAPDFLAHPLDLVSNECVLGEHLLFVQLNALQPLLLLSDELSP